MTLWFELSEAKGTPRCIHVFIFKQEVFKNAIVIFCFQMESKKL